MIFRVQAPVQLAEPGLVHEINSYLATSEKSKKRLEKKL